MEVRVSEQSVAMPQAVHWAEPWTGALSQAQRHHLDGYARRVQGSLATRLYGHEQWPHLWEEGLRLRDAIVAQDVWSLRILYEDYDARVERRRQAGATYRSVLLALFGISIPAVVGGRVMGAAPVGAAPARIRQFLPRAEALADRALTLLDEPIDHWRRMLVVGLMVHRELVDWCCLLPFGLVPDPMAQAEPWRKQIELPVAVPQRVAEAAARSRQALEQMHGVVDSTPRSHPPTHRRSEARQEWVEYALKLRRAGYTYQIIAADAEACRLYRVARNDVLAELTVDAVGDEPRGSKARRGKWIAGM